MEKEEQARSFSSFISLLEDGQLNSELSDALKELNAELNNYAQSYGSRRVKGKIKLELDFTLEQGMFDISAKFDVKTPEAPRNKTVLWSTPGNNFTPQNPRQMDLLAPVRDVTSRQEIR